MALPTPINLNKKIPQRCFLRTLHKLEGKGKSTGRVEHFKGNRPVHEFSHVFPGLNCCNKVSKT